MFAYPFTPRAGERRQGMRLLEGSGAIGAEQGAYDRCNPLSILVAQAIEWIAPDMTMLSQPTKKAVDHLGVMYDEILWTVRATILQPRAQYFFAHETVTGVFARM